MGVAMCRYAGTRGAGSSCGLCAPTDAAPYTSINPHIGAWVLCSAVLQASRRRC
jgi:hypothetical protein